MAAVIDKSSRGVKRRCGTCSAPFYDMLRVPIQCPKCGALFRAQSAAASAARRLKVGAPRGGSNKARQPGRIATVQKAPSAEPEDQVDGEDRILDAEDDED